MKIKLNKIIGWIGSLGYVTLMLFLVILLGVCALIVEYLMKGIDKIQNALKNDSKG